MAAWRTCVGQFFRGSQMMRTRPSLRSRPARARCCSYQSVRVEREGVAVVGDRLGQGRRVERGLLRVGAEIRVVGLGGGLGSGEGHCVQPLVSFVSWDLEHYRLFEDTSLRSSSYTAMPGLISGESVSRANSSALFPRRVSPRISSARVEDLPCSRFEVVRCSVVD